LDVLVLSSSNNPDADLTNRAYVKFAVTDAIKKSVYAATGKEPINPKVNISDTIMDSFQNSMLEYKANVTSFRNLFTNHILPTVQLYASNVLSTVSDSSDTATRDKTASLLAWVMLAETVPDNPTLLWDVVKGQQTQIQTQIVPPPVAEKVTFVTVEKAIKNIPTVEDFVNLLGESKDTRMEKINRIKANSTEVKRLLGNPEKKDTNGNTHSKLAGDIVTTELYPDFIKYLSIAFPNTSFNENENLRLIGMLVSNFAISNKQ